MKPYRRKRSDCHGKSENTDRPEEQDDRASQNDAYLKYEKGYSRLLQISGGASKGILTAYHRCAEHFEHDLTCENVESELPVVWHLQQTTPNQRKHKCERQRLSYGPKDAEARTPKARAQV